MEQRITEHSLYWIQATIFQGKRLIDAEKIKYHPYSITRMEEQFFLNAINKAIRWVTDMKKEGYLVNEIDNFLSVSSVANFIRNKREYDDEYFGSKQKKEKLSDASNPNSKLKLRVGPSVTVHREGKIILGGTVDVQEVIDAAKILEVHLRKGQHKLWENKSFGDIKNVEHFLAPEELITK